MRGLDCAWSVAIYLLVSVFRICIEGAFTNENVVLRIDYGDFGIPFEPDSKSFAVFQFAVRGQFPLEFVVVRPVAMLNEFV